ncbi:MAG: hypothetical protein KF893_24105 [Caldilineaceae bacterium]|nr:hypothetical protein [Caldilineaceae bacterium]
MTTRTKSLLAVILVLAFSLIFFVGSALAQDDTTGEDGTEGGYLPQIQAHMEEHFGAGAWAEMFARMTERHGAEFTAEHLQWMDENGCPMLNGESQGAGMMRHGPNSDQGQQGSGSGRMMGRGRMHGGQGHGMMHNGQGYGMMGRWMDIQGE